MGMEMLAIDIRAQSGAASHVTVGGGGQLVVNGRPPDAQIPLDSNTISRRHAEMMRDPFGRWWIRDLGSRNGTHVNGTRVTESVVKPGDLIQLGEYSLSLSAVEDTHATTPTPKNPITTSVPLRDGPIGKITSLKEFATPRLAATHLSTLTEFGQTLLSLEEPAQRIAALCKLMVRPEFHGRCAVALRASKETLTEAPVPLCANECAADDKSGTSPYISRTLLRTMLARNEPVVAGNSGSSAAQAPAPDFAELSISAEVMSISALAVPIKSEKSYTDLLYVILPPEYGTAEWLALAALAVKQFQQAESTWVAKKLSDVHAAIERELSQAHTIQERLVPRNIHVAGLDAAIGFTPCKWVGGDYVDIVPGKNGKVLLTVADVCGKGLPAALVASSLHMMTHTAMRANTPLAAIMQNLNVYLSESLAEGTFVTMLAVLLDPVTGTLETVNAGHPPGVFVTPTGERSITLSEANMPLGLDAEAELVSETTTLEPGTFLVMFTDGLTELPVEGGELLGDEALAERLTGIVTTCGASGATEVSAKLTALLDSLQVGMSQDDRTFLVVRRV
jgi:sigma-B regulation protein RsbU (phosphoserine phosphatase)